MREALSELAGIGIGIASGTGVAAAVLALRAWIARCNASEPAVQSVLARVEHA